MIRSILMKFILGAAALMAGQPKVIDTTFIKVFFVYPLSTHRDFKASWFEVMRCETETECQESLLKIPLVDLKPHGNFEVSLDEIGRLFLDLKLEGEAGGTVRLAQSVYRGHWYEKVEICGKGSECFYEFEADPATKSINLKIQSLERD